jgi:uncharacterized membrane protein
MKKILLILLVLSSTLALNLEVNGTYCGEQIIHGILENEFQAQVTINSTRSRIYVSGGEFCFAPEKSIIEQQGFIRLFATVGAPLPPDTYVESDIMTSVEKVTNSFYINFTECECNIQFPTGINVEYFPPSSEINPGKIKITGSFIQCSTTPKLMVVTTLNEACMEIGDIIPLSPFTYITSRTYTPSEAKRIKVKVYAWEPIGDNYGYVTRSRVDFSSFSVTTEPGPAAEPGGSTWVSVHLTNTGTLSDQYTISLDVPEGWAAGEIITKTLLPDESLVSNVTVELPPDFKGAQQIEVRATPTSAADPITVLATVETEKIININTRVDVPPLIKVGENFTIDIVLTSTSTHQSDMYYYIYTEPASKIKPLVGRVKIDADEQKQFELYGEILESCGADSEHTQIFSLLEDVRALGNLLQGEIVKPEPDEEVLNTVKAEFSQILIQLVPTKVYDQVSRIQGQIQRLLEDYHAGRDPTRNKESLAFILEGLDEKVDISQDEALAQCTPTDQYKIKLVLTRIPNLQNFYGEDASKVSIEDVFRIEYPKRELRMQAGKSGSFDLIIYNVGETRRSFDISARGLTESWVSGTTSFSLDPGYSKTVTLTVRPPKLLSGEFKLDLIIHAQPYSLSRTIPILIGKYGIKISAPTIDILEPNKEKTVQFTVSNLGEVEDNYKITFDGENWVNYEKNITVEGRGDYLVNVTFNPPSTASGKYYFDVKAASSEYPEISDSIKIKVEVSAEEMEIDEDLTDLRIELNALYEQYGESQKIDQIFSVLNDGQASLMAGRLDQAKLRLSQVRQLIAEFKADPPQETPVLLYALVIIIPLGGYVIATIFMKKQKTPSSYKSLTELGPYQSIRRAPPPIKYRRNY